MFLEVLLGKVINKESSQMEQSSNRVYDFTPEERESGIQKKNSGKKGIDFCFVIVAVIM